MTSAESNAADSTPYKDGAPHYPVRGWTGVLPIKPGAKSPLRGVTGWNGADPTPAQIAEHCTEPRFARCNLSLRMPMRVIGIDVDAHTTDSGAAKRGDDTMAHADKRMRNQQDVEPSRGKNKDRTAILTVDDLRDPARPTCSVPQAAALLNISKDAAYRMAESGRLPTVEITANRRRVSCAGLLRLLEAGDAQ